MDYFKDLRKWKPEIRGGDVPLLIFPQRVSLCNSSWLQTQSNSSASASQMLNHRCDSQRLPPWLLLFLRKFHDWHISMCTRKGEQESRFQVWIQRQASHCLDGRELGLIDTSCAQSSDLRVECRWLLGGGVWLLCRLSVYRFQVTRDQRFCSRLFSSAIKTDLSLHPPPLVF